LVLWDSAAGAAVARGGSVRTVTAVGEYTEVSMTVKDVVLDERHRPREAS
jgi:uncharacterized membrane protein